MTVSSRYASARAFRVALETRLRQQALSTGASLDRLRKEVAHQRLLARLAAVAPHGTWALKGGLALIARMGPKARATKDADTSFRTPATSVSDFLEKAAECELGDYFAFQFEAPKPIRAEGEEGGLRYSVLALVDGRQFERLHLDVNLMPDDPRPIELIHLRDLLDFAGEPAPAVPAISVDQHLAEKIHAYSRQYPEGTNSRAKDLFDMLVMCEQLPIPPSEILHDTAAQTFALRSTPWPPTPQPPPSDWDSQWAAYVREHGIAWKNLISAFTALSAFWRPILERRPGLSWDAKAWAWVQNSLQ